MNYSKSFAHGLVAIIICMAFTSMSYAFKTVNGAGGADYTTIQAAVDNATAGETIEISSGTYTENVNLAGKNLILQSAASADVVIQHANEPLYMPAGSGLTIRGTAGHPLILRRTVVDKLVEGGGQNGDVTFQYVQFDGNVGTTAASIGTSTAAYTITFDHCDFTCTINVCGFVSWGSGNVVLNDCNFNMIGDGNAFRSTTALPGKVTANRCQFIGTKVAGGSGFNEVGTGAMQFGDPYGFNSFPSMDQEIVATDCVYNGFAWAYEQWDGSLPNANGDKKTIRMVNPHFGVSGDDRQIGWARLNCGETLYITGKSATDKCDLRNSTSLVHGVNVADGGRVTIQDVILRGSAWFNHTVNINGNSDAPSTVTLDRCLVPDNVSNGIGNRDNGSGTGLGSAVVNLTNCIMIFQSTLFDFTGASSTKLNLLHCTLFNKAGVTATAAISTANGTDSMTSNYSIFSTDDATDTFANIGFTGTLNILNHSSGTGFGGSIPGDTILGDPKIDTTGHLTNLSALADQTAVASTLSVDYENDGRPWFGTVADIGADEGGSNVPVELSSIVLD